MKRVVNSIIYQHGTDTRLITQAGIYNVKAFLQLVTSKSWQNMERMVPTGGEIPRGQYLYIGPAYVPVQPADTVQVSGHTYVIRRADTIYYRNEPLFIWGLCVEGGEGDPWTA